MALKASKTFCLSMLTGILSVSQESIFSKLNNVRVNTMLDEGLGEAFGFTEDEALALAEHVGKAGLASEMREWYDGYRSGGSDVYNPWSLTGMATLPRTAGRLDGLMPHKLRWRQRARGDAHVPGDRLTHHPTDPSKSSASSQHGA